MILLNPGHEQHEEKGRGGTEERTDLLFRDLECEFPGIDVAPGVGFTYDGADCSSEGGEGEGGHLG